MPNGKMFGEHGHYNILTVILNYFESFSYFESANTYAILLYHKIQYIISNESNESIYE